MVGMSPGSTTDAVDFDLEARFDQNMAVAVGEKLYPSFHQGFLGGIPLYVKFSYIILVQQSC